MNTMKTMTMKAFKSNCRLNKTNNRFTRVNWQIYKQKTKKGTSKKYSFFTMSIQTLKILLWIGPTRGSQHIDLDETMIFFLCIRNHNTTNRWRIIPSKQWHLWCDHVDPTLQSEALWLLNKKYFIF